MTVFRDLGFAQQASAKRDYSLYEEREDLAMLKLDRTQSLALNFLWRARFVSGSALPGVLYGAAAHPIPDKRVETPNSSVFAAIWRSGWRCASEVVLGLLVP